MVKFQKAQEAESLAPSSKKNKKAAKNLVTLAPKVGPKDLKKFYYDMTLIRRFEERAGQLYGRGLIAGFCHLYIGQEAVVVGMQAAQKPQDAVITAYRDHGHMLVTGMDPRRVMAELTGRQEGYSKGKGGSMHMFSREANFYGGHGIVGAQIPLGTGLAFAQKYRGEEDSITVAYMGDGAANQGQVYEAFNMASLWKLPIIYIIENNHYAMGTSVARGAAGTDFTKRGDPWGIPGHSVDGMDVLAVRQAGLEARQRILNGEGPQLLVMETYRYRGHSMSDPATYRSKEEVDTVKSEQDPIDSFKARILKEGKISEEDLKGIDQEIKALMKEVVTFSEESPEPDASELMTDILLDA
ncbi:MAG: pyruvate dehydrogenase (acetyl-transferring) E1 component subunit alpha [bacterium]|nr:pyruvate dehydrogenase (acetyl-transferring) E1 component subunit alpha [bacterium]